VVAGFCASGLTLCSTNDPGCCGSGRDKRPVSAISIATGVGAQDLPSSRAHVSIGSAEGLQHPEPSARRRRQPPRVLPQFMSLSRLQPVDELMQVAVVMGRWHALSVGQLPTAQESRRIRTACTLVGAPIAEGNRGSGGRLA
jgi:hypothetical protein